MVSCDQDDVDDAWKSTDRYGTNTVRRILEGKDIKRAINVRTTTLIVIMQCICLQGRAQVGGGGGSEGS